MKTLKYIVLGVFFLIGALQFTSCKNEASSNQEIEAVDKSGPEYTSAYICPMHCKGSGSEAPGKCPVCGMDYVENKESHHDHGDHEGHNH